MGVTMSGGSTGEGSEMRRGNHSRKPEAAVPVTLKETPPRERICGTQCTHQESLEEFETIKARG